MTLAAPAIITAISGLTITGVSVKDDSKIPLEAIWAGTHVLSPLPNGFISNYTQERQSIGSNATVQARYDVRYDLTYRYFHCPVGSGRGLSEIYSEMVSGVFAIVDVILANDAISSAVDLQLKSIQSFGAVTDATDNTYHGCDIVLTVLEYV